MAAATVSFLLCFCPNYSSSYNSFTEFGGEKANDQRGTRGNGARPILTLQKQDVTSRKPVLQDFFSLERACYVRDVNADGRTREGVAKGRKQLMRTLSDRGKAIRYISRLQKGCLAARLFGCNVSREAHSPHFYFVPFLPNSHMLPLSPESAIVMYRSA